MEERRRQIAEDLIRGDMADSLNGLLTTQLQTKDSVITDLKKKDSRKQEIIGEMAGQLLESEDIMGRMAELHEEEMTVVVEKLTRQRNVLGGLAAVLLILMTLLLI